MADLFVLTADKNMQYAIAGGIARHHALGTAGFSVEYDVHIGRDGGVRTTGVDMLKLQSSTHAKLLLVMDFDGCGTDHLSALDLERDLDSRLDAVIGGRRAKAIVVAPECDCWIWGSDNSMSSIVGWERDTSIRDWIRSRGFQLDENGKPSRPKEAIEALLRFQRIPRSSSLYKDFTSSISLANCADPAFLRMRDWLQECFPIAY